MTIDSAYNLRRLATVLKDSIDAITVQDLNGIILAWNKGAEILYGYSENEALGMSISKIMPQDSINEKIRYLAEIANGNIVPSYETTRITKDGRVVDVWIVCSSLRNDSGKIDSISTTERDITSFKNELRKKDEEVKILRGLLPICSHCKKIRDVYGAWQDIEKYITVHSEAAFSHGICSKCAKKYYPEVFPDD